MKHAAHIETTINALSTKKKTKMSSYGQGCYNLLKVLYITGFYFAQLFFTLTNNVMFYRSFVCVLSVC